MVGQCYPMKIMFNLRVNGRSTLLYEKIAYIESLW